MWATHVRNAPYVALSHIWSDGTGAVTLCILQFFKRMAEKELAVSPRVKVLVRHSDDPANPLLLDLDDEILAFGPECISRAHWIAKAWIRRLREPIDDLGDISAILSRRTSKYARDQAVVAVLLADVPDLKVEASEAEIHEKTLLYLGKVTHAGLMHGQPTLTNSKGFSWSPCAVTDMRIGLPADIESRAASDYFGMLDVFQGGSVRGEWRREYLDEGKVEHIHNISTDISLKLKVASALNDPSKCLLLRPSSESEKNALLVGFIRVDDKSGYVHCCYIGLVSYDSELSFNRAYQFIIGSVGGSYGVRDARQAIEGSRLKSEAEDVDETPLPDSLGPDQEDSDTTDAFKSAIEQNSEPAMRYLLRSSGWGPVAGHRNNKELFTRPWRPSQIQKSHGTTEIYGLIKLGLLLLELNKEKYLVSAKSAYRSACNGFKNLPHTKPSADILLYREKLLVKAHIFQLRGLLEYPSTDSDDTRGAIEAFKRVLDLQKSQKKSARFSEDAGLQLDDHAAFQDGFGLNTSQHETSQWKRLQLDSLVNLALLHIGLDEWKQAAEYFFEVISHFTKDESGQSGSDVWRNVQQMHLGVLEIALKHPEPPTDRSAPANDQPPIPNDDQQRIPTNHILSFYHIARRALAAFRTIFRGNHLLIDLTNFYIGRAFHLLALTDDDIPTSWIKATGTNYLKSAKEGLKTRPVFIPRAIRTRIGHSLEQLSEEMQ